MQKISLFIIALFSCLCTYGQTFTNVISGSGLPETDSRTWGVFDYNNDGFEDILLGSSVASASERLRLFKNNGNSTFTDVTLNALFPTIDSLDTNLPNPNDASQGFIGICDFDNDGFKDILSVEFGPKIKVYCGNGTGGFIEKTNQFGLNQLQFIHLRGTMLLDIDKDGLVDLCFYSRIGNKIEIGFVKNNGGTNSAAEYKPLIQNFPINREPIFQFLDYDRDNDQDLIVIDAQNDAAWPGYSYFYWPILVYKNQETGFTLQPNLISRTFSPHSIGVSDYNQDGNFDLMGGKCDFSPNSNLVIPVVKNLGSETFMDVTDQLNFSGGGCYEEVPMEVDYDLDGDLDYFMKSSCANNRFFQNNALVFSDVAGQVGTQFNCGVNGNRPSWLDYNNDGTQDYFGMAAGCNVLAKNNKIPGTNWLQVKLSGCQSGKDAFRAVVSIKANNKKQYRINYSMNYLLDLGQVPKSQLLHFGLGTATTIDSLVVKWPSGQTTILTNVQVNQTLTVNESQPTTLTASGALTFCQGGSVTLSTNTTGNTWYKNGTLIANQTGASLVVNSTGSYTVQGTSSAGCTSVSNAIQVTVNPAPAVPVISASGPLTFCQGGSVTLSNTSPGTKQWLRNNTAIPNQTGNTLSVNTPGSYTLRISNTNGCQSTSQASTVVVNPLPVVNINPSGPTTFCSGGSVTLTASGGGTYLWSNNQTTPAITVSASGSYVVTVTANGCSAKDTQAVVVNPQPVVTLNIPAGNFININQGPWPLNGNPAGGTYSGVGISNGLFNPITSGLGSKQIGYTYTSAAGCTGSKSEKIIVYDTTGIVCTSYDTISVSVTDTLFINAVLTQVAPPNNRNTIKIYPNPANTQLTIDNGNYGMMQGYKIRVTNSLGQEVFFSPATQQQFDINLSTWTGMGVYFVHLIDDQGNTIQIKKIILQ
jgi:hypothetical protein